MSMTMIMTAITIVTTPTTMAITTAIDARQCHRGDMRNVPLRPTITMDTAGATAIGPGMDTGGYGSSACGFANVPKQKFVALEDQNTFAGLRGWRLPITAPMAIEW